MPSARRFTADTLRPSVQSGHVRGDVKVFCARQALCGKKTHPGNVLVLKSLARQRQKVRQAPGTLAICGPLAHGRILSPTDVAPIRLKNQICSSPATESTNPIDSGRARNVSVAVSTHVPTCCATICVYLHDR